MRVKGVKGLDKKVKQLFEYLLALRHLTNQPIREIKKYEKTWMLEELPSAKGCFLGGSGIDSGAYLEVHQQTFKSDYPSFDDKLGQVLSLLQFDYTKDGSSICEASELELIMVQQLTQLKSKLKMAESAMVNLTRWERLLLDYSDSIIEKKEADLRLETAESFMKQLLCCYKSWIEAWSEWAHLQKEKRQIQKMYDYFFQLRQMMKSEEQSFEIMMGIGLLTYQLKQPIHHPMLVMKLELDFDAERGVAKLLPSTRGYQLDLEVLAGVEFSNQQEIMQLKEAVLDQTISPFDSETTEGILRQLVHYMHPNGVYLASDEVELVSKFPMIKQQSVLFVRKRSEALLKEDLQSTIDYISEGGMIPKPLQAIIDVNGLKQSTSEAKEWAETCEQLLFPLPANEEQKDVARRLANNIALTVQGPPGTGKSHTIVNLIAHLLAHGKRVLVTSEKDKALRVLLEKLPEEIQPLCVSFLGGDRHSLAQIEQSIRAISDGLATYDTKLLEKEIQVLGRQLDMVRRQKSITKNNLVRFKELDAKGQMWKDKLCQPYEFAQIVAAQSERLGWVKDKVDMEATPPLSEDQFVTLWELKGALPKHHQEVAQLKLPALNRLMSLEEYRKLLNEERGYLTRIEELELMPKLYELEENRTFIEALSQQLEPLCQKIDKLKDPLEQRILEECLLNEERSLIWETVFNRLKDIMTRLNEIEVLLVNDIVECSYYDHPKYEHIISSLKERLQAGKGIGGLYLTFKGDIRTFYENTRVNGNKISSLDELTRVEAQRQKNELLLKFSKIWNKNMAPNGGDFIEGDETQVLFAHNQKMKQFGLIMECLTEIKQLNTFLSSIITGYKEIGYENLSDLKALSYSIELTKNKMRQKGWQDVYQVLLNKYKPLLIGEQIHSVGQEIYDALVNKDLALFSEKIAKVQFLNQIKEQYQYFYELLTLLKGTMPLFATKIMTGVGVKEPMPGTLGEIIDYAKLVTFLDSLEEWKSDDLEMKFRMLEKEETSLIKQLIFKMTWNNLLNRVTPEEDRALQTWMQVMNRIGKGTGRQAQKFRREARLEMEKCQNAIPVWIMPSKEAIENFKVNPDLFDVVIIDESSQCNVLSLPLLMRGKRVVIVGDDQQISPIMPGISDAAVKDLMSRYLYNIENGNSYDLKTSLYDIACRVFSSKGKLMLKEHFRCVPEIIGFSNHLAYYNEMIPLKLPDLSEQFNQPVMAIYVENGARDEKKTNINEAIRIVEDIKSCIENKQYEGKSMGVISLLGGEQAKLIQKLLLDAIGEKEMVERQIICGDAYSFQGDERDVMFLSLVIAPNVRYNALNKKMYTQRFNVAASRARSQMRLYHSVTLSQLSPEDLRYELLAYCQHPRPMYELVSRECETMLECDVKQALESRGYEVKSKVSIGKYQMDLVIENGRQRLAIECDGDTFYGVEKIEQAMERQQVLERAGWKFIHLRGSVFYRDQEKALQPILNEMEQLNKA